LNNFCVTNKRFNEFSARLTLGGYNRMGRIDRRRYCAWHNSLWSIQNWHRKYGFSFAGYSGWQSTDYDWW